MKVSVFLLLGVGTKHIYLYHTFLLLSLAGYLIFLQPIFVVYLHNLAYMVNATCYVNRKYSSLTKFI